MGIGVFRLALAGLAVSILLSAVVSAAAPKAGFKVDGPRILDPKGNEFVVKGVNVNGPYWPWNRPTAPDARLIADAWKFNAIRVCCFPRLQYNGVHENQDLDEIVRTFTAKGVVVMIENHDVTGRYPRTDEVTENGSVFPSIDQMKEWWIHIATSYKDNPYVWFNTMNEPGKDGLSAKASIERWKEVNEVIVKAIRDTGAKNPIVLDGHDFGQEGGYHNPATDSAIINAGTHFTSRYDNIVFSLHMYAMWAEGEDRLKRYIADAQGKGLALIIGEYGANDSGTSTGSAAVFNAGVPAGVGRMVWSWDARDDFDLTKGTANGAGWEIDKRDGSRPTNLNWLGGVIWDDNHGTLKLPVVADVKPFVNGGFESGMAGWMDWGRCWLTDKAHTGSKALVVTAGDQGGGGQNTAGIKPNTKYRLTVWGMVDGKATGGSADVGFQYKAKADGPQIQKVLSFSKKEWVKKEVTFTTGPVVLPGSSVFLWKSDKGLNLYVDDVAFEEVTE